MAGSFLATVPLLILFAFVNRHLMNNIINKTFKD